MQSRDCFLRLLKAHTCIQNHGLPVNPCKLLSAINHTGREKRKKEKDKRKKEKEKELIKNYPSRETRTVRCKVMHEAAAALRRQRCAPAHSLTGTTNATRVPASTARYAYRQKRDSQSVLLEPVERWERAPRQEAARAGPSGGHEKHLVPEPHSGLFTVRALLQPETCGKTQRGASAPGRAGPRGAERRSPWLR